ncbi:MBL fold metallo-hydrolase [Streptomyces sp. MAR4 CNX-425]|uniref:MBL fold metallo-hydrolase n=1 Tax=Streptomyces sp. MAR4 CNX-425 TaxID=3406343 RepID=UPI003B50CD03
MPVTVPLILVMGVSGCGKTTVGRELAERLNVPYADGADISLEAGHSGHSGDFDEPPDAAVADWFRNRAASGGVVSRPALRRRDRDRLAAAVPGLYFLHLDGTRKLVGKRLAERKELFVPHDVLDAQFAALEPLGPDEHGAAVGIDGSPAQVVNRAVDAARTPYCVQLATGVHAYVQPDGGWCLSNAGFVSDGTTTLLVDTAATEPRARLLREAVLASGAPDPSLVVNTHHHGDHTYGNSVFTPATVVGHAACRQQVLASGRHLELVWPEVEYGDVRLTAPDMTYTESMTLTAGGTEVRLLHPGPAHTVGDTVVWLPEQRIVFAGDIALCGGTPFVAFGSLGGSLRALELLRSLGAETVVPGHGPVTDPGVFDTVERYLRYVGELAAAGRAAGRTPLETARAADPEAAASAGLREPERLVANLHRAYSELAGEPEGHPLDAAEYFADMARVNGGEMMPCHA